MQTIVENMKLLAELNKNKISLNFVKKYNHNTLFNCCSIINDKKIKCESYENNDVIQEQLITNETFADYLIDLINKNISAEDISSIILALQEHDEKITDYTINSILQVLKNDNLHNGLYFNYLKYFSIMSLSLEQQNLIAKNLYHFNRQGEVEFSELTENERNLFLKPIIYLLPSNNIKIIYNLLSEDNNLMQILDFIQQYDIFLYLSAEDFELIHEHSAEIYKYIQDIFTLLSKNVDCMQSLLQQWAYNKCSVHDFKILTDKIPTLKRNKLKTAFNSRSSYINMIYGNKLCKFPLSEVMGYKEDILIYAIVNNKNRFIQLIEENSDIFLTIGIRSLLFDENLYTKRFNLNSLNINELSELGNMSNDQLDVNELCEYSYTFQEIKTLYGLDKRYIKLYNKLLSLKIDERLLIIRQLAKKHLLPNLDDESMQKLVDKLLIKNLYKWLEQDFTHIEGITHADIINILISYEEISKFIPQVTSRNEALYMLGNIDSIQSYNDFSSMKKDIVKIDTVWIELANTMNFNEEFVEQYSKNINNFLFKNGADMALTYYKQLEDKQKESFKRVVKAELMGEFEKLKYYKGDLEREIDYPLTENQVNQWSNNLSLSDKDIEVTEFDDFYNTISVGVFPQHTCLSYISGSHNDCLLSCFDSNKKILYAKINGKVIGRAIVRLTKGSFNGSINESSLSFVDLENLSETENNSEKNKTSEGLTLFLEKSYIVSVPPEIEQRILELFIAITEKKANLINATLILSNYYSDLKDDYARTKYYLYISKSKAGSQYLDSLGGAATISDEGSYKSNTFMMKKCETIKNTT